MNFKTSPVIWIVMFLLALAYSFPEVFMSQVVSMDKVNHHISKTKINQEKELKVQTKSQLNPNQDD